VDKSGEVNRHTVRYILLLSLLLSLCSGCNRQIANGQQSFNKNQMACNNLFNRAVAHEIDGEYDTAISDFTKILENDPEKRFLILSPRPPVGPDRETRSRPG
jgi:outer membrane protein assembly factor BamD (BamD/ComL family)